MTSHRGDPESNLPSNERDNTSSVSSGGVGTIRIATNNLGLVRRRSGVDDNEDDDEHDVAQLFEHVAANDPNITTLHVWDCSLRSLTQQQISSLTVAMQSNSCVDVLDLSLCLTPEHNEPGATILPFLEDVLPYHTSLKKLILSRNQRLVSPEISSVLGRALATNSVLAHLDLYDTGLMWSNAVQQIMEAITTGGNTTIDSLVFGCNNLNHSQAKWIASALTKNQSLKALDLFRNSLGEEGTKILMEGLSENTSLEELNIGYNHVGERGFLAIGATLAVNTSLAKLVLARNRMSLTAVEALSSGLRANDSLLHLNLSGCVLANPGAIKAFVETALPKHKSLRELILSWNNLKDTHAQWIGNALKTNQSLVLLDLEENLIGNDGARALADGLRRNTTLKEINLQYNLSICDNGFQEFASVLREASCTLEILSYSANQIIPTDVVTSIRDCCKSNKRANTAMRRLSTEPHAICLSLWPRCLALLENKSNLIYSTLRRNPQLIPEQRIGHLRRSHNEAFGNQGNNVNQFEH